MVSLRLSNCLPLLPSLSGDSRLVRTARAQSVVLEVQLSAAETEQLLKSTTLTQLGAFDFKPLTGLYLDPELITGLGDPTIRVNRALRAGVSAGQKLRSEIDKVVKSPSLSRYSPSRWYVCLWSPLCASGFVTSCYRAYTVSRPAIRGLQSSSNLGCITPSTRLLRSLHTLPEPRFNGHKN